MSSKADFFPHSDRVVYANNPLAEVICQLRFPTVLKVESDIPADFQERIRHRFPIYEADEKEILPGLPEEFKKAVGDKITRKQHQFRTEANDSSIFLSREAIGISTTHYERWELFKADIDLALSAATEIYRPSYFSRIGLRYRNLIDREAWGLAEEPWCALLRPEIAGELCLTEWAEGAEEVSRAIRARMNEEGDHVLLQHGIALDAEDERQGYLVDFDYYYSEKVEIKDADEIIERLHSHSGKAFRWAITDALHRALGPSE
jgi:uncharacterized protein (TIGR04255 family)